MKKLEIIEAGLVGDGGIEDKLSSTFIRQYLNDKNSI